MKKILLIIIAIVFTFEGNAQENLSRDVVPSNFIDIGLGLGSNYGLIGTKVVIGKKGSGVLIGLGRFDGFTTFSIGAQITHEWWFASLTYGSTGSYRIEFNGKVDRGLTKSIVFITGVRIDLNSNKRLFLELGIGFTGPDNIPGRGNGPQDVQEGGFSANIGLGYRL